MTPPKHFAARMVLPTFTAVAGLLFGLATANADQSAATEAPLPPQEEVITAPEAPPVAAERPVKPRPSPVRPFPVLPG